MKRSVIVILTIFFAFQFLPAQEKKAKSPEVGQAFNQGLNLAKKQKYEEAIVKFKEAVAKDDNFPDAHYMLGYCYKKLNDFGKAEQEYKKTIDLDSKFEKAYVALGNIQALSDRKAEAINTYNAVLAINENNYKANFALGKVYFDKKEYKKALPFLKKAVTVKKKYVLAHTVLGLTYKNLKKLDEAAKEFDLAITYEKRSSKKGTYYFRKGEILLDAKKYKAAEKALLNALKLSRSSSIKAGASFYLGEVYRLTGRKTKALKYYAKAAKNRKWKKSADYQVDLLKHPDKYVN